MFCFFKPPPLRCLVMVPVMGYVCYPSTSALRERCFFCVIEKLDFGGTYSRHVWCVHTRDTAYKQAQDQTEHKIRNIFFCFYSFYYCLRFLKNHSTKYFSLNVCLHRINLKPKTSILKNVININHLVQQKQYKNRIRPKYEKS